MIEDPEAEQITVETRITESKIVAKSSGVSSSRQKFIVDISLGKAARFDVGCHLLCSTYLTETWKTQMAVVSCATSVL